MYVDLKRFFSEPEQEQHLEGQVLFDDKTLPNGAVVNSSVQVKVDVSKENVSTIKLHVISSTVCEGVCARCLEDFTFPCETESVLYISQKDMNDPDREFPLIENKFDIDEFVKQEIILHMPLVLHCNEDCEGLCAICGTPKKIGCECEVSTGDPRLQILKELLQ